MTGYTRGRVCVVIPTYNERENIGALIGEVRNTLQAAGYQPRIVIVDDNSPDGTADLVADLAKTTPGIHLLRRRGKLGLGSAYREGFRLALSFDPDFIVQMDADFSHNPKDVPRLIGKLEEGFDIAVGSRYVEGGEVREWSLRRRLISRAANLIAKAATGVPVKDSTSGFRALRRSALERMGLEGLRSEGFDFQVELQARARRRGLGVAEVPIVFLDRRLAESKLSLGEFRRFLATCLRLFGERIFKGTRRQAG